MQRRACIASHILSSSVVSPRNLGDIAIGGSTIQFHTPILVKVQRIIFFHYCAHKEYAMLDTFLLGGQRNFGEIGISAERYQDITIPYYINPCTVPNWFVSSSTLMRTKVAKWLTPRIGKFWRDRDRCREIAGVAFTYSPVKVLRIVSLSLLSLLCLLIMQNR